MRTSRKTDFRKLKITLVTMTCDSQRPQCFSLSPHVLLQLVIMELDSEANWTTVFTCTLNIVKSFFSTPPRGESEHPK